MGLSTSISKQLLASTILVAAGSIYGGLSQEASAGSCATADVPPFLLNVSCTGAANPADVTQSFNSVGGVTITDIATFGLDTTMGGDGIITNGGTTDITITGTINADGAGINSNVTTAGATTEITNKGDIITDGFSPSIVVNTGTTTGNVTIANEVDATIEAGGIAIFATVNGMGAETEITNGGDITTESSGTGIFVTTGATTGNVTITNEVDATIEAGGIAIFAVVNGFEAETEITNGGDITTESSGTGIFVTTVATTGNVTITNEVDATIEAGGIAIFATVNGFEAETEITNGGDIITESSGSGISVTTGDDTSHVTIANEVDATIEAGSSAIFAVVNGMEAETEITNGGDITTENTGFGIAVSTGTTTGNVTIANEVDATIEAGAIAIQANVDGFEAETEITNGGDITTNDSGIGIAVSTGTTTGNVTITNGADATIEAGGAAIFANLDGFEAETEITNEGDITAGGSGTGIRVITDATTGNVTITNGADATIEAGGAAIFANLDGFEAETEITNEGDITSGTSDGIFVNTDATTGNVTIANEVDATIEAGEIAIHANVGGMGAETEITNGGDITADDFGAGILVTTDATTSHVTITNEANATIEASNDGILAEVKGAGATTEITNGGDITTQATMGFAILVDTDDNTSHVKITNEAGASIETGSTAIFAQVTGTNAETMITNSGNITNDDFGTGISFYTDEDTGNVSIKNDAGAMIEVSGGGIFGSVNGIGAETEIINGGDITTEDFGLGIGVEIGEDTGNVTIKNEAGAMIEAVDDGIFAEVNNSATTTITSSGTITSATSDGIVFEGNNSAQVATVNIEVSNKIDADGTGIWLNTSSNAAIITSTIDANSGADIDAKIGIDVEVGDSSVVAVNIKAGASVIGTNSGILDTAVGSGDSATTTVTLEGELGGNVDLADNDDVFTMKGAGASITAATALIDGGDGMDVFNFDNVQMAAMSTFTTALKNFELIELKNGSFIRVEDAMVTADDVKINGGNTLEALGVSTLEGVLENNGTVSLADGAVDDVFTVDGNLSGSGTFVLDANLNASENSDQVVVTGDVMGAHNLSINNLSGGGVDTGMGDTDGIKVVDVTGTATAASFALASGPVNSGAYVYDLHMSAGNDFYLQSMEGMMSASAALVPSVARGSSLGADALMLGYRIRKGSRLEAPINLDPQDDNRDNDGDGSSFGADILHASQVDPANTYWLRLLGAHGEYEGRVDVAGMSQITDTDSDFGGVQLGVDFAMPYYPHTYASLWGHYLYQENDVYNKTQAADAGSSTINSYGVGLGITYDPGTGLYFDALGSVSFSSADLKDAAGISGDTRGNEYFASAEIGYRLNTGYGNLTFIPQAQIKTHIAEFASYTDSSGLRVSGLDSRRSDLRLGVSAENTYQMSNGNLRLVGGVSWVDVFSSETQADLAAVQVDLSDSDNFIEGNLGFQYSMDNGSSIWASVNHKSGLDSLDSENTSFDLGFSVKF